MLEWLEKLRMTLLNWNVAPLSFMGFLCYVIWTLVEYFKVVACTIDPVVAGIVFTFLGGICTPLLNKMYNLIQKNNKQGEE